ncbi:carbohydrate ABC transporter permease [Paenibacillus sp. GCM10027629]|uniref:carbohydrate ABC transporter permease n=1 Tax=Paenibacillus sp. GCM10027629 TaxID=3273414 RepID=UPI00363E66C7
MTMASPQKKAHSSVFSKKKRNTLFLEIIMILIALATLIPLYYLIVTTFKTGEQAAASPLSLPTSLDFTTYINAWNTMNYTRVLLNNVIIAFFSVAGIVLLASMAAYGLERRKTKLTNGIFVLFLIGLMIPFQVATIPLFRLIKSFGLNDTLLGVILINIFLQMPFNIFLMKNFIKTVPMELEESGAIDGCGTWRTFWNIVFPLLTPIIATLAILASLSVWNDFYIPLLFLQSREKGVILLEVYRNIGQFSVDWTSFFPMMVLSILPLLILYLFMQKYIIQGIASGAIKG